MPSVQALNACYSKYMPEMLLRHSLKDSSRNFAGGGRKKLKRGGEENNYKRKREGRSDLTIRLSDRRDNERADKR